MRGHSARRLIGFVFIGLGVVANKWTLERILAADGSIENPVFLTAVWVMDIALITAGLILLRPWKS